eukprot:TRINITY_DN7585_c0_g1_i1.p1 TRINITY_DN7585_c0_g1~~TRINITY_DN7585_c0_g1_i1.p1  ORF type:complete len:500 (+),score=57.37 TRINITY_DN7585_c0_g1_i1:167-1666(+)
MACPHRLIDLCLKVVVINLHNVTSLEGLPDDICQKLISMIRANKKLTPAALRLFYNCKLIKLDLHQGEDTVVDDGWLTITHGEMAPTLQHMDFSGSHITDKGLQHLNLLPELMSINTSSCDSITGSFLTTIPDVPLTTVNFERCRGLNITQALINLAHFTTLRSLNISTCSDVNDDSIHHIQHLTTLTHLDISNNNITATALQSISSLHQLSHLSMAQCTNISSGLSHLQTLTNLTFLTAAHCHLNDETVQPLGNLTSLKSLTLVSNKFGDQGMQAIGKLKNLTTLDLSMCTGITDEGIKYIESHPKMSTLNLNYCSSLTDNAVQRLNDRGCLQSLGIIGCNRLLIQAGNNDDELPLVLLAEDNPVQGHLIKKVFERSHFKVALASNGQMALDMYKANPRYHLILMDVMMPIMDGLTTTMLIRQYEGERGLKRTPIIIQSADTCESHRVLCLEAGGDEFLKKPLDRSAADIARQWLEATDNTTDDNNNTQTRPRLTYAQ